MRRSHTNYAPVPQHANAGVEEENERMTDELEGKIGLLKTLAIDMGTEVKYHNKLVTDMSDDMENSRGFLGKTMDRVLQLGRGGHNYHLIILFLFCFFVLVFLWVMLKFS